ncbi:hypothetical protein [Nocardiopsis aegyptia]|uniref:Uncharacterized protein n=1 Tax=Nocardiopsis aegyptia TaxID=220378 RepID=A0A7Z0EJX8_9ACTN|nr:hypothetical protein [Nocardiopsis aegyptia]NYJ33449.1 hypothetical protein [Nocardiopsis aegyptia]
MPERIPDDAPRLVNIGGEVIHFPTRSTKADSAPPLRVRDEPGTDIEPHIEDAELVDDQEDQGVGGPSDEVAVLPRLKPNVLVPTSVRKAGDLAKRPDLVALAILKHEVVYGTVGTARGAGTVWRWMTAAELDQHLATNPKLVLDTRRVRRNITLATSGTLVGGGIAAWFLVGPGAVLLPVLLVLTVAGVFERRRLTTAGADAGHAALGPAPSGKEVKRVFVSAKLARRVDDLRIIGPVTRTGNAWESTIELPPGTTYKAAAKRRGELAGAIGVDEVQVAMDPVKGHAGRVKLWVADEDPMQGERVVSPLVQRGAGELLA